jgi:hypothetical protein
MNILSQLLINFVAQLKSKWSHGIRTTFWILGGMIYLEMLAMFFVDGGETSKWRLRKHAA